MENVGPNKAIASFSAVSLSGALVTVGVYLFGHELPPEVVAALTAILGALLSTLAVWMTPHGGN